MVIWLAKCTLKPGSDLWLDVRNLQLCRAIDWQYVKEQSDIEYIIENYNDKAKYKAKDSSCEKIKRYLIISLEEYNI